MAHNLAIIPARGGSKRIPRKNIKPFLGVPIIAYSIKAALESGLFDEVMVSTDDAEIREIALKYGAKVPFMRSEDNSGDFATTADVIIEVLDAYQNLGRTFDNACCIYPSAPFTTAAKLQEAYGLLTEKNADTVFPVMPFSFPVQRAVKLEEGRISFIQPEFALSRSQDLEPAYHDAGQFYFFNTSRLAETKKIVTDNTSAIIISELEAQDIDNEVDWKLAEMKYRLLNGS